MGEYPGTCPRIEMRTPLPLRAAFPRVPSAQDFLRAMIRVDGCLVFTIGGGAPREPIDRDDHQIGQVRGVFAQKVVVSIPLDPFLSIKALAAYSSLSPRTLHAFIDLPPTEALPCYRLPGKVLVRRSEFDAWLERFRSRGRPSVERAMRELGLLTPEADHP